MYSLFKKEIKQFLGSLIGYLVILVFLLVNGLFLWVFPSNYNILENGYATLESLFALAPWLYLFLVPAVTMRLFAEEKRGGTIEFLLTRPIGDWQLVAAKYLAALTLVLFSLLPTLLWFFTVYRLGNPVGNMDVGATWGSFAGLFFLAAIYVAIGIFASSLTDNQIVSFIVAMALSFVFYQGFEFIAGSGVPYFIDKTLTWFSISEHYRSVSRGIIDLRDIIYFLGMAVVFIGFTTLTVRKNRFSFQKLRKGLVLLVLVVAALFLISENIRLRIDLTAEKRYSLSPVTRQVVQKIEEPVLVELFLDGELPPGFRKLQQAVVEKVNDLSRYAGKPVRIKISDPYAVESPEQRKAYFDDLEKKGIRPTDLRQKTEQGVVTRLIFPGARIQMGAREVGVNFLKNSIGFNHEVNLNHSVESVEYELVSAIQKLMVAEKQQLVFLTGHEELNRYELQDLGMTLSETFQIRFLTAAELRAEKKMPGVVVIADPKRPFSENDKFAVDQALMKGSRLLWLVDPVQVSLDSLSHGYLTLAFPRDLNLSDQLFQYGVRLNPDLVQDVVCAQILVNTSPDGSRPQFTPQPWYYSPLLTPADNHPLSRNLNLVQSEFVSSIDTVSGNGDVRKQVILKTSAYGRIVKTPAPVSLESINRPPARELFTQPDIPVGVLLEGRFRSVFRNRLLPQLGVDPGEVVAESEPTKMMVFSDGNLIANKVRYNAGSEPEILPLGYDRVSQQTFGNKEFFVNTIRYLTDEDGIMQLRNRTVKLRLLDKVKLREGQAFRVWFNVTAPLLLVVIFGLIFTLVRRRRFSVQKS